MCSWIRFGGLAKTTATHVWSIGTEGTDVYGRKASTINADALAVKPVVARFTGTVSNILHFQVANRTYHWIMKPSLSGLLQTHLVVPLRELDGVAPSGSVIVVGDMLVEEL